MTGWAIGLAMAGAGCYAVGARWQNRAVQNTHSDASSAMAKDGGLRQSGRARMLPLLRDRGWLGGLGMLGVGTVLHVTALSLAPLTVVQPVGVLALPLAALLDAHARRARLSRSAVAAIAACTIGVALFVARAATITTPELGSHRELEQIVTLLVALVAGLAILSATSRMASPAMPYRAAQTGVARAGVALRSVRSLGQITAAGSCFGFVAVLTKLLVAHFVAGDLAAVAPLAVPAMLAALGLGGWWAQQAHAGAPTEVVVAGLTVIDPLVAVGLGAAVLGEAAGAATSAVLALLACGAVAAAGVIGLARHHTAQPTSPTPTDRPTVRQQVRT
ncbi:MAG: hypothetical protein J0I49_08895 [Pseudonocardia sp.]|uniref:DMT family transporter n=1 Tax=Pseudonocardia sp. TaxID=60912 RepID=UPI001ACE4917|nr:DMT family transporter [Pseudonocardia sp.]MBN9098211.1 hypothetical protein [Pseudonocardia sp.]